MGSLIDKVFTEKIAEFISMRFTFCVSTMGGSQNELCRVDMVRANRFVRIMVLRSKPAEFHVVVGEKTVSREDTADMLFTTIWNSSLNIIWEKAFLLLGNNWFIPIEDAEPILNLRKERRERMRRDNVYFFPKEAERIALPYLQRQPKMKSKRLKDIQFVCKHIRKDGSNEYGIVLQNGTFVKFKKKIDIRDDML